VSGGWSRITREAARGSSFDGCTALLLLGTAFPFIMLGLAYACERVGDRYGAAAGIAVFTAPGWLPVVIGLAVRAFSQGGTSQ
jgi:hypothetical protein